MDPLPIRRTLRDYSWAKLRGDAKAALNVALLDFPQGMAYALIAGLPVQFGIFCSSLASLTGPVFASSRFVMLGPTNATAVMLLSVFLTLGFDQAQAVAALPLLLVLVGIFMIAGALLRAAVITQYISRSVIVGYITAAAGLIIVNQLKTVFGLDVPRAGTFAESLLLFIGGLPQTQWQALLVGGCTLLIYYLLKHFARGVPTVAAALLLSSLLCWQLRHFGVEMEMLNPVNVANWPLSLPQLTWNGFNELVQAALAIAFLSLLESSSISKTLAAQAGDRIDLNQQMLSMGASNFVCAFGSGMTVSGSLTRSVLNYRSGAKTAVSSMLSGLLLIAGLFLLGGLIGHIPRAALAALVITVGISLVNRETIKVVTRTTRSDAAVFFVTLGGGLILPLDTAIYLGAAVSILFFVRKAAQPALNEMSFSESGDLMEKAEQHRRPEIAIVHVEGDLFFASCDLFLEQMRRLAEHPQQRAIILRLRNAHHLDATVALTLGEAIDFCRRRNCEVIVSGAHDEVERVFLRSGLMDRLGADRFFKHNPDNPTLSTRDALIRARELTGIDAADITIFAKKKEEE